MPTNRAPESSALLARSWRRCAAAVTARPLAGKVFDELVARYSEPHRKYHTLQHLAECLAHVEAVGHLAEQPGEVEIALWFHDGIYDTQGHDNERQSADWARAVLEGHGAPPATGAQRLQVQDAQAAVFDPDDALLLQRGQRLVHALARQAHQVGQLLLRDAQHLADAGVQHRVEQRGQVARHAHVGVGHAVDLARGDELPSRSLSWFITKRLKPIEWSSSQWKVSTGRPATTLLRSAWML
jgi:predicted metal-dependent HD superfamily phosphohydrolase